MSDSLFAAIRLAAHIIAADGKVDPKELNWFIWLMNNYGLDVHRRLILEKDLKGQGNVEEIHKEILNPLDRKALINWARVAMNVDGDVDPREKDLFERLVRLNEEADRKNNSDYIELGKSILQLQKENQMWNDLAETGRTLNMRLRPGWGYRYAATIPLIRMLSSGNRIAIWFAIAIIAIMIFIMFLASRH